MILKAWCLCVLLCLSSLMATAGQLRAITVVGQGDKTALNIEINGAFTHTLFVLNKPYRIVMDLKGTSLGTNLNQLHLNTPLIQHIRSGKPGSETLRLVVDVSQALHVHSSLWKEQGRIKGITLELDPVSKGTTPVLAQAKTPAPIKARPIPIKSTRNVPVPVKKEPIQAYTPVPISNTPIRAQYTPSASLRDVVVVLDAGHGGKDPGARGPHRSQEKEVVLAITLKLKRLIDKQPGMRAVLTRSGDYYVGLRNRLDIARKYNGDIFVSIHADAFNNPNSHGASVFALSQSGATSEAARWIAEKENYSELGGVNLGDLDDQNGIVRSVLIDLSQTSTINSSVQMGGQVLTQLNGFTLLHNNKVEQARFMVLKSPDIPSILVETGFISNPREERNLTSYAYQLRLSQAIFQGIKGFFWESPPHGTRIEALTASRFHIVKAGETIPLIAKRYSVSVASLESVNHVSGRVVPKLGQKLVVPSAWA
ncbi:MAG: N-acetylmuramoyl-L-alanine amidase [Legionellales bacterium]